jgi:hypothetical protein
MLTVILALGSTGCASKAPGDTPTATVQAFVTSMQDRDAEAIYNLLSGTARAEINKELQQMQQGLMEEQKQQLGQMGVGTDKLGTMSGKEYFIAIMDAFFKMADAMAESFGTSVEFNIDVGQETINGNRAQVVTTDTNSNKVQTLELVREGSLWYLAANPAQN